MTKVTAQMSVSLDGFYTGPRDTRAPQEMSGWMRGPEAPGFFNPIFHAVRAMRTSAAAQLFTTMAASAPLPK